MLGKWSLNRKKIENTEDGYAITVCVPMYRSLALSMIEGIDLKVDRHQIPMEMIALEHRGNLYPAAELGSADLMDIYWDFSETCRLMVKGKPLEVGKHEVILMFHARVPYLIPSDGEERPNYASDPCREVLTITATGGNHVC